MSFKSPRLKIGVFSAILGSCHYINEKVNKVNGPNEVTFYPLLDEDIGYISNYVNRACMCAKLKLDRFDIKCQPTYRIKIVGNQDGNERVTLCIPPYFFPQLWKTLYAKDELFLRYHKIHPMDKDLFPLFDTFSESPDSVTFATLTQIYVNRSYLMKKAPVTVGLACPVFYFMLIASKTSPLVSLILSIALCKSLDSFISRFVYLNADKYAISCLDDGKSIGLKYLQDVVKCKNIFDGLPIVEVEEFEPYCKARLKKLSK